MSVPTPRLVLDIRGQPASLARVLDQHAGPGRRSLDHAARLLKASSRVIVVAIGASLNAAIPFEYLLCAHGIKCESVEAGELLHYRLEACGDATIVLVSRSGESVEIAKVLAALRGRVPIIGVTNESGSTLAQQSDVALEVGSLPDEMVAIQTHTGTLLTLYLLGMTALNRYADARRELDHLLPQLPTWIEASLGVEWGRFLDRDACVYALGRGASYGSAAQAALLFSEIAKAPAVAMPVASFRHGPMEIIDGRFRALVFAPRGRTRELNVCLAKDILRFGGAVRLIGAGERHGPGLEWIAPPGCPEMLAPLLEIVPAQVAAVRLAEIRGLVVGSFRFVPQVTRDEATTAPATTEAADG